MQIKRLKIATLKFAGHNPKARTKKGCAKLRQLERSIEKIGLIYPLAVASDMTVIDGHRRLQAAINLGWEDIPSIIVAADDKDEVYAEVNANSARLTGNENLSVWLSNPRAVTARVGASLTKLEGIIGRKSMVRVAKAGMSTRVFSVAEKVARYVETDDTSFLATAAMYIVKHRNPRLVESYIATQQSPRKLYGAIKASREIKAAFAM